MPSRILIAAAAIATAACCLVEVSQTGGIIGQYREGLPPPAFALWLAGLVAATIGTPACALSFWLAAKRVRHGWLLHIVLVPAMYALAKGSPSAMLGAAGEPDLDSLTGSALLLAMLLFPLCTIAYCAALGVRTVGAQRQKAGAG